MDAAAGPHDARSLFDRICMLRELYARRGPRDREGVISISDAIEAAIERLTETDSPSASTA
jgi:hypothetical protein